MKVLTVYAHPNQKSFCGAILKRFMSDRTRQSYLERAYKLGKEFAES